MVRHRSQGWLMFYIFKPFFFSCFRIYSINVLLWTIAARQKHSSYFLFHFPNQWASDLYLGKHLTVQNAFVKSHQWPRISNRVSSFASTGQFSWIHTRVILAFKTLQRFNNIFVVFFVVAGKYYRTIQFVGQ